MKRAPATLRGSIEQPETPPRTERPYVQRLRRFLQDRAAKAWTPARAGVQPLGARYGIRHEDVQGKRIGNKKLQNLQAILFNAWRLKPGHQRALVYSL